MSNKYLPNELFFDANENEADMLEVFKNEVLEDIDSDLDEMPEDNPFKTRSFDLKGINPAVLGICQKLHHSGFDAWIVGGCIRDLMLNQRPKDFDVVTVAKPTEVKKIFGRSARLIGKRFQIVHVVVGARQIIEVSTLRTSPSRQAQQINRDGRIEKDNHFGNSVREDALRRDFTINGIYYDPKDDVCIDFVNGSADLYAKRLICIGDPHRRFREDPVRMTRAIRFEAKLGFTLGEEEQRAMFKLRHLLSGISPVRLLDECLKLFHNGHAQRSFAKLQHYGVLNYLLPLNSQLKEDSLEHRFIQAALRNTDQRIVDKKGVSPPFIFAVFLWYPLKRQLTKPQLSQSKASVKQTLPRYSVDALFRQLAKRVKLPRLWVDKIYSIWSAQDVLEDFSALSDETIKRHKELADFRASFDFLVLRMNAGETNLSQAVKFWRPHYREQSALAAKHRLKTRATSVNRHQPRNHTANSIKRVTQSSYPSTHAKTASSASSKRKRHTLFNQSPSLSPKVSPGTGSVAKPPSGKEPVDQNKSRTASTHPSEGHVTKRKRTSRNRLFRRISNA